MPFRFDRFVRQDCSRSVKVRVRRVVGIRAGVRVTRVTGELGIVSRSPGIPLLSQPRR